MLSTYVKMSRNGMIIIFALIVALNVKAEQPTATT